MSPIRLEGKKLYYFVQKNVIYVKGKKGGFRGVRRKCFPKKVLRKGTFE